MRYLLIPLAILIAACQPQPTPKSPQPDSKTMEKVIKYGGWPSPISAASTVKGSRELSTLAYDNGYVYWVESRPEEEGRSTIMRWKKGQAPQEVLPSPWNARTRVQEYGGRSILVHNNVIWFTNFADQRVYRMSIGQAPKAITPQAKIRFGGCELDTPRDRLICIREDHRPLGEAQNTLVSLPTNGMSEGDILFKGSNFVSAPGLSPNGKSVAFISWNHPNMPWDNTTLWSAVFDAQGQLSQLTEHNPDSQESVTDPQWDAQGNLYAISDRNNWWSLYQVTGSQFTLLPGQPEHSELGGPAWTIGKHYYYIRGDGSIIARITTGAISQLYLLDPAHKQVHSITPQSAAIGDFIDTDNALYVIQDPQSRPAELIALTGEAQPDTVTKVIRTSSDTSLDAGWIPAIRQVSFPVGDKAKAYGTYFPPTNPNVAGPKNATPPLIVMIHGGPTASASPTYSVSKYFWTSRGFGILDVNYRGSTGFGRTYRRALYGQWGVADVEDAIAGAKWLAEQKLADPDRLIIRGGSAGGYTTLAALATSHVFKAGASYYGISDIQALAKDTHKFESRYLDQLIGPYPERKDLYIARSPINHLDGFNAPLLLLQGLDDKVVPPNQSKMIFEALKAKGIPTAYIPFKGEGHGFRKSEDIIKAMNAELYFYSNVLGFPLTEDLPPVDIVGETK